MGIDMLNGYGIGSDLAATPHLDQLKENGVTFVNAWSTPQCSPTRAGILSGKYGVKTGVFSPPANLDLEHQSIFHKISEATENAYKTAVIGKWHVSDPIDNDHPLQHGADYFEGFLRGSVNDYYNWTKVKNGSEEVVTEYATSHLTSAALEWINQQSNPWFLWLAHATPHTPFHEPPAGLFQVENTDNNTNKYLAAVEAMDFEIGRLLDGLDQQTKENTVIIFCGDNGTPRQVVQYYSAEHAKGSLYEGGMRIPFIISGYEVDRKGEEEEGLVHTTDLFASILEIIGIDLEGGVNNSYSFKSSLQCNNSIHKEYNYSDHVSGYTIRNDEYKLITFDDGSQEFYHVISDLKEENNLINMLTDEQEGIKSVLESEGSSIRSGWSCNDRIKNGDEPYTDACILDCEESNGLGSENIGCCDEPSFPSVYYEFLANDRRVIYTNDYPNHSFCYNPNLIPQQSYYQFEVEKNPALAGEITPVTRDNGRPARYFGIAKNGVIMAPAPALPFVFENPNTGEFNWDWVFEPINNQGDGMGLVALDCASAHTGPQGYHYHGDMYAYIETFYPGLSTTSSPPGQAIHIGWAADGFPILYRFGPDENGNLKELKPSFKLKVGDRPGDGITAPCGVYNGKYTSDYDYLCGDGDLDACNGIERKVSINTSAGLEEFAYFYLITSEFPQIPRCLLGTPSADFDNSAPQLTGEDQDGDGFITSVDCDDSNADINPNAMEIEGNEVDENCDGSLLSSSEDIGSSSILIYPNPSLGSFTIVNENLTVPMLASLYSLDGKLVSKKTGGTDLRFHGIPEGLYLLTITSGSGQIFVEKISIVR